MNSSNGKHIQRTITPLIGRPPKLIRLVHITTVPQTAASFLRGQLSYLRRQGMEITIISSPGVQLEAFARQEGVAWADVPLQRAISPLADLAAIRRLRKILRQIDPHIVHAHTPKAGLVGMLAAASCHVPVRIYHLHGLRFETAQGVRRRLLKNADRLACKLAHRVLCVSSSVRDRARDEGLVATDKADVLASGSINGIRLRDMDAYVGNTEVRRDVRNRLGIPADAKCVGFVGRLVRDKGIIELDQAWRQLRTQYPDLHLLLVGPFEDLDPVPADVRANLSGDPRVHLTGLDWNPLPYYAAMDVFTLPTYREGLPTVLLEAAAMRLPVVACRVTGCVDAVPQARVRDLVPAGDAQALSAAIATYLDSPSRCESHAEAGRRWVAERFRPTSIWSATHAEYTRLLPPAVRPATVARAA